MYCSDTPNLRYYEHFINGVIFALFNPSNNTFFVSKISVLLDQTLTRRQQIIDTLELSQFIVETRS